MKEIVFVVGYRGQEFWKEQFNGESNKITFKQWKHSESSQALEKLTEHRPSIIVIDAGMSETIFSEWVRKIKGRVGLYDDWECTVCTIVHAEKIPKETEIVQISFPQFKKNLQQLQKV